MKATLWPSMLADEHAAAVGVALGGDDFQFDVAPGEGFVVLEVGVDGEVLGEGEEGVAVVVVVVDALVLPEEFGLVEDRWRSCSGTATLAPCSRRRPVPQD